MIDYVKPEAMDHRSKLVMMYGEGVVRDAEQAAIVATFFALGILKPNEFIEIVDKQCARIDDRNRRAAGFTD
jgi:hypothetical protein